tara:strand:+ start:3106 stop:4470 length:1365 start_codon:yes stop_codon:yes gene_type:complete
MSSLLIKNAKYLATMDGSDYHETGRELYNTSIFCENGIIKSIFSNQKEISADKIIDASNYVVIPGLVNTHHHLFQTLTKAIYKAQNASLFEWLKTLYPIWSNITPIELKSAVRIGLSELILSGCTTSSDHQYIFPNGVTLENEIEVAEELGIRFHPTRGSMSIGESNGGLPPDYLIEDEKNILKDSIRVIERWNDPNHNSMIRISLAPCSPFSVSKDLMVETAKLARHYQVGLHTHLAENFEDVVYSKEIFGLTPGQYIEELGWTGKDVWHAHCVKLTDNEINLFAKTKTGIAHCPCSNMRLGSGIIPLNKMLNKGVDIGLGVDGSASNDSGNLLNEARQALYLQRVNNNKSNLNARQALWLATAGGAKVLNRNDIGSLKLGNCADFAIYDLSNLELAGAVDDPIGALIFCGPLKSKYTICNGKILSVDNNIVNLDIEETIAKHNTLSLSLLNT